MDLQLSGKVALVLAASHGLGFAVAQTFVREGASVMIASRNQTNLDAAATRIDAPAQLRTQTCDVNDAEAIDALVAACVAQFGHLDILVNNAGGPKAEKFEGLSDDDWQQAFNQNLRSNTRLIRATLPHLKKTHGTIVNIASSSVKEPIPGLILSNVMRAGIGGLAKTLSKEFGVDGITVNTVAPGRIATQRLLDLDHTQAAQTGRSFEDVQAVSIQQIPLGRLGTPQEFANVVVFLASGAGRYVNGQTILVDGGASHAI